MESPGLAFAWFPSGEFEAALEHWPDLMDEPITDHTEYCVYIEGCLRDYAAAGGDDLVVAPATERYGTGRVERRAWLRSR